MGPSNNLEKNTLSDTYWRVQLVYLKVQAHSSLEPLLEHNQDAFEESRFIMTFSTILQVMEVLCSFRLVLEGKTVSFFSNNFALLEAKDNNSRLWNRRFAFVENTVSNLPKVPRTKFLGSDGFFCFSSICKFGSFKNLFATITSLSELYLRIRRFFSLVQTKKVISMNYGSSTSSWKPWRWVRLDLILTMRDIYINCNLSSLTKYTSNRSIEFIKISSYGASLKWSWRHKPYPFELDRRSMKTETGTWSGFHNGQKTTGESLASKEINKSKKARLWKSP